jgi:hypothetical protein
MDPTLQASSTPHVPHPYSSSDQRVGGSSPSERTSDYKGLTDT